MGGAVGAVVPPLVAPVLAVPVALVVPVVPVVPLVPDAPVVVGEVEPPVVDGVPVLAVLLPDVLGAPEGALTGVALAVAERSAWASL